MPGADQVTKGDRRTTRHPCEEPGTVTALTTPKGEQSITHSCHNPFPAAAPAASSRAGNAEPPIALWLMCQKCSYAARAVTFRDWGPTLPCQSPAHQELGRDVLVRDVVLRELERDREHVGAVHGHPRRRVRLLEAGAGKAGLAPVEGANIIQPEEAALEEAVAVGVLLVGPPVRGARSVVGRHTIIVACALSYQLKLMRSL